MRGVAWAVGDAGGAWAVGAWCDVGRACARGVAQDARRWGAAQDAGVGRGTGCAEARCE